MSNGYGGYFEASSSMGAGVFGHAPMKGVYGTASGFSGKGVHGEASGMSGAGVYGLASGIAIAPDTNINYGGYFEARGTEGIGVYGIAPSAFYPELNRNYGGYFEAGGTHGRAVYGVATYVGGTNNYGGFFEAHGDLGTGVWGQAAGIAGRGVTGWALGDRGRGVYGFASNGTAGYFHSNTGYGLIVNQGNVGIGTETPEFKLSLSGDGGIIAEGTVDSGTDLTIDSPGTRLIWYPKKAAFRAGQDSGGDWSDSKVGINSVAMNYGNVASGWSSTAMGSITNASGDASTAMGVDTSASGRASTAMGDDSSAEGDLSTAMGSNTNASGWASTAMGSNTTASGSASTAMGRDTTAQAYASTVLGRYNVISEGIDMHNWVDIDPLFVVGNGERVFVDGILTIVRSNALTLLKNGKLGIGAETPEYQLDVRGDRIQLKEDATGDWIAMRTDAGAIDLTFQGAPLYIHSTVDGEHILLNAHNNNSRVGIGTNNPQGTLDVNGAIYQRGVLHADYVFEPDYKLESIDEHAEFMWTNKHLKSVPKARVDENGIEIVEVGSHRKGILEELEKAHIYIEQLNRQIKKLEERLAIFEENHK
jgi:hypothetical protein